MGIRFFLLFFCLVLLVALEIPGYAGSLVDWTMIDVNSTDQQGDSHLLRFADGENDLIDVGVDGKVTLAILKEAKVDVVHKIIISHPHKDHYGGLRMLLNSPVKIGEVWMNMPDRSICDSEIPWGCDYGDLKALFSLLRDRGVAVKSLSAGQVLHDSKSGRLEVLYAFDGVNTPVGRTDINDTSVLVLLTAGKTRALFTGDLNAKVGAYLAEHAKNLSAQILKVPHHGTDSVAPNAFFDAVAPALALVPSPRKLWLSDRSRRARDYFQSKSIRTYVNGLDGNVSVSFTPESYTVSTKPAATR